MPKNNDISSILVMVLDQLLLVKHVIDYSGVQACKALKEEGIKQF